MRAGRLRHRPELYQQVQAVDEAGSTAYVWLSQGSVWGAVEPIRGREALMGGGILAEMDTRIVLRYSAKTAALVARDRIRFGSVFYNIQSIVEVRYAHREIEFMCKSGVNDGEAGGGTAPVIQTAPVVTGVAQPGGELSTTYGTWSGSPDAYAIEWLDGATVIPGETGATYTIPDDEAQVGKLIRSRIVATNSVGPSAPALSNQVEVEALPVTSILDTPFSTLTQFADLSPLGTVLDPEDGSPVISTDQDPDGALSLDGASWLRAETGLSDYDLPADFRISFDAWRSGPSAEGYDTVVTPDTSGGSFVGTWGIELSVTRGFVFLGNGAVNAVFETDPDDSQWHAYEVERIAGIFTLKIDGDPVATTANSTDYGSTGSLYVGSTTGAYPFKGQIRNLVIERL